MVGVELLELIKFQFDCILPVGVLVLFIKLASFFDIARDSHTKLALDSVATLGMLASIDQLLEDLSSSGKAVHFLPSRRVK